MISITEGAASAAGVSVAAYAGTGFQIINLDLPAVGEILPSLHLSAACNRPGTNRKLN